MIVPIAEALDPLLQGRVLGRKHFAQVCELLADAQPGEVIVLDFTGVELVTGSWVNAMIVPLFRWVADEQNDLFPVLCNFQDDWLDDLQLVAEWNHQCYLLGNGKARPPRRAKLVGSLDPGQQKTLRAMLDIGEATGAQLERQYRNEKAKATAWNNRLKDLNGKRLLMRRKQGREQFYSPVIQDIVFDG